MSPKGFVYIARDDAGNIKVGSAENVQFRMNTLRRKHPKIKAIAIVYSEYCRYLEKFIHLQLKEYEIVREWYFNEDAVMQKITDFLDKHGSVFCARKIEIIQNTPATARAYLESVKG